MSEAWSGRFGTDKVACLDFQGQGGFGRLGRLHNGEQHRNGSQSQMGRKSGGHRGRQIAEALLPVG